MSRIARIASSLALSAVIFAGCQDSPTDYDPEPTSSGEALVPLKTAEEDEGRPLESLFAQIGQQVKSFAGFHYDEEGNMVALLTDLSEESRLVEVLKPILEKRDLSARERSTGRIVVKKADFPYLELSSYRQRTVGSLLRIQGIEWLDLDEAQNRIVLGLSSDRAKAEVGKVLKEQRVPERAVLFEESGRVVEDLSLRDRSRPIEGGFQIQRENGGTCTLGFNAYRSGTARFITNSHCTASVWGNNSTKIYQNDQSVAGDHIGTEAIDPAPFTCWLFFKCRWSDAAVITRVSSVSWNFGRIARTESWGSPGNNGSITVDSKNPRMTIIGEYSFPTGGEMFDKMGRTTGWTYGFVKKTCVDMNKSSWAGGGTGLILCQDWTNYNSDGGDSGSPVFRWYGSTVRLAGIHWGSITQGGKHYGILSAMWNIEKDLGALTTF